MKLLYVTIALLIITINKGRYTHGEEEEEDTCEDCEEQIDSCLIDMQPILKQSEPLILEPPYGPCQRCEVTNINKVIRRAPLCAKKKMDGTWVQDMQLKFGETILAECDCQFATSTGQPTPAKLNVKWSDALVRTILEINNGVSSVKKGEVDCDEPSSNGCAIPPETVEIECLSDNDEAKKKCEENKDDVGTNILKVVAQSSFPGLASEKVNTNVALQQRMSCQTD